MSSSQKPQPKTDLPRFMQTAITPKKTRRFLLRDYDGKHTFYVVIFKDFVSIRPVSQNHAIIIGTPDSSIEPDKNYETSIYVCDHANVLIKGKKKGDLEICVSHDEFPTRLAIDETEGKFQRVGVGEFLKTEPPEGDSQP